MKKKLIMGVVALLVVAAAGYKFTHKKPVVKQKINGSVYVLPKDFLINLNDGQYAKITLGLVLAPGQSDGVTAATAGQTPADGIGTLPEEPVVRSIVTNILTNQNSNALIEATPRASLAAKILRAITTQTDVKVTQVLFCDLAVQ